MNLEPGAYVVRHQGAPLAGYDVYPLSVGQLINRIDDLPGRWRVAVDGGFERWHEATILRMLKDANEGASILAAQLGAIKLAERVMAASEDGRGPRDLWSNSVTKMLDELSKEGLTR